MTRITVKLNCPTCGNGIAVSPCSGGRGTGELTSYGAYCDKCGMSEEGFGDDGRKATAIREVIKWILSITPVVQTPDKKKPQP
jgi:hypothetical protein